jgi:hypothetical protein
MMFNWAIINYSRRAYSIKSEILSMQPILSIMSSLNCSTTPPPPPKRKMTGLQLPEPFATIPRESFLFGPSPIQYLPNITNALGGKVAIYAKREDCNSGLAFGGNKTRKLE